MPIARADWTLQRILLIENTPHTPTYLHTSDPRTTDHHQHQHQHQNQHPPPNSEDSAAYHFLAPWFTFQGLAGVPTYRISGLYPRTAFFDFSSYNGGYIKAIDKIADYEITPSWVRA
jgi:hypothetical protein